MLKKNTPLGIAMRRVSFGARVAASRRNRDPRLCVPLLLLLPALQQTAPPPVRRLRMSYKKSDVEAGNEDVVLLVSDTNVLSGSKAHGFSAHGPPPSPAAAARHRRTATAHGLGWQPLPLG